MRTILLLGLVNMCCADVHINLPHSGVVLPLACQSDTTRAVPSVTSFDVSVTLGGQELTADIQIGDTGNSAATVFLSQNQHLFAQDDKEAFKQAEEALTSHMHTQIMKANHAKAKADQAEEAAEQQEKAAAKQQEKAAVYNVMVCQIPIQIDGSTVVLKAYEGEEVQALVESFIVTKNGQFANQKQQVVDAVLGAARDQQPTPTVVQTTIPNVQIQAAVNGDVVIYENDSFNNVVRRYTYAFGLSYEEGVALEMFVKEHFAKSQQAANTAETAETEETAETAETVAEESNALETFWNVWIPENWAALVLSMSLTEQVSTNASTGQSVFVATVIVAVLVIARMLHNPAASEAAPAETTKDVPLVATKTTEETSDKKVSTKKKSKKRAKSVGKKK